MLRLANSIAKDLHYPLFAVALLNTGPETYTLIVKKLDAQNVNNIFFIVRPVLQCNLQPFYPLCEL